MLPVHALLRRVRHGALGPTRGSHTAHERNKPLNRTNQPQRSRLARKACASPSVVDSRPEVRTQQSIAILLLGSGLHLGHHDLHKESLFGAIGEDLGIGIQITK